MKRNEAPGGESETDNAGTKDEGESAIIFPNRNLFSVPFGLDLLFGFQKVAYLKNELAKVS